MISNWKKTGKLSIVGKLGILFVIGLIFYIPNVFNVDLSAFDILTKDAGQDIKNILLVLGIVTSICLFFLTTFLRAPFYYSQHYIYIRVVREEKFQIKDAFIGFSFYKQALKLYILMFLYIFIGFILFVIPGIILIYKYKMAFYLLCEEPELTPKECLKKSSEITAGYKMDLFLMDLSFIGWDLLALLTLGILYIWLTPYKLASTTAAYLELNPSAYLEEKI